MNQWVGGVEKALGEFLALPANWDSYGARRIDPGAVQAGIQVLYKYVPSGSPPPHVVPTSRGGVQIEWHTQGIDLQIEVVSPDSLQIFYENSKEQAEEEFESRSPFTDLPKFLAEKLPRRIS
jgi:hypothetical protein